MQLQPLKMKTEPPENAAEKEPCGSPDSSRIYLRSAYTYACILCVHTHVKKRAGRGS